MEGNTNLNLYIINGGLFQIYYDPIQKYNNYSDIKEKIIKRITNQFPNISSQKISDIFNNYSNDKKSNLNVNQLKESIEKELQLLLNISSINDISIFNESDFQTIPLDYLKDISQEYKISFLYKSWIDMYIDYSIMTLLKIDNISYYLENDDSIQSVIELCPKNKIIFDFNLNNLYRYYTKGCITVYLTHLLKLVFSLNQDQSFFKKLNEDNLSIIREKGTFFSFSIFFFIQLKNYFPKLLSVNSQTKDIVFNDGLFKEELSKMKLTNVLVFYRYFFKSGEIKRAHLFLCNDKINYISYVGNLGQDNYDDLLDIDKLHKNVDIILPKFSDAHEVKQYTKIIQSIITYTSTHPNMRCMTNLSNIGIYLEREKMINYMQEFSKEVNDPKVQLPVSHSVKLTDVYEYEQFKSFMEEKNLQLPIILKYSGPNEKYNHLIINIITEKGLQNYISFIKDFSKGNEDKITLIVQRFVNHGGYVIKGYYIKGKSYFFYRPSFPDVSEDLVSKYEEYSRGFFQTTTSDLVKDAFKNFWKKISKKSDLKSIVDETYMNSVMEKHEKKSKDTLFGIDFLFDYQHNVYYIVDINQFPGYKELIPEFNTIITEHCLMYSHK